MRYPVYNPRYIEERPGKPGGGRDAAGVLSAEYKINLGQGHDGPDDSDDVNKPVEEPEHGSPSRVGLAPLARMEVQMHCLIVRHEGAERPFLV